jgi:putative SOS response-associated peptidase YedK
MPGPPQYGGQPVTNIRNGSGPDWRGWRVPKSRCVVPETSFCEYADFKPHKTQTWFALTEERPALRLRGLVDDWC